MEAIVLAGGLGTRLRPVVSDLPKSMAPVAGRPFLEILLFTLASKGFERVVLSLGYMADKIITHFGNEFQKMELVYVIEKSPLGTGGAVKKALSSCLADHVYVLNGDTFLDFEVDQLELCWQANRNPVVVARKVPDTSRYGRLAISGGRVCEFLEKGEAGSGLINAGCYLLPPDILNEFERDKMFSLEKEFLANAVKQQPFDVFITTGQFIDIGIPEDYMRAQSELAAIIK